MAINDLHRHTGGVMDAPNINIKDVIDYHRYKYIPASDFDDSDANITFTNVVDFAVLSIANAVKVATVVNIFIPTYKKGISSIDIIYYNRNGGSDIVLGFSTRRARVGHATVQDILAAAAFTVGATTNYVYALPVPKTAWNGLQGFREHDIVGLTIARDGTSQSDTYGNAFEILGLLVQFG